MATLSASRWISAEDVVTDLEHLGIEDRAGGRKHEDFKAWIKSTAFRLGVETENARLWRPDREVNVSCLQETA